MSPRFERRPDKRTGTGGGGAARPSRQGGWEGARGRDAGRGRDGAAEGREGGRPGGSGWDRPRPGSGRPPSGSRSQGERGSFSRRPADRPSGYGRSGGAPRQGGFRDRSGPETGGRDGFGRDGFGREGASRGGAGRRDPGGRDGGGRDGAGREGAGPEGGGRDWGRSGLRPERGGPRAGAPRAGAPRSASRERSFGGGRRYGSPAGSFRQAPRTPGRIFAEREFSASQTGTTAAAGADPLLADRPMAERHGDDQPSDLIWGRHPAQAALESGRPIHRVWCTPEMRFTPRFLQLLREAKSSGVLVEEVTWARLGQLTGGAVHQGIVLQAAAAETLDLPTLIDGCRSIGEPPLLMALDGITDPHNLGAIARSAEALGAHGLVLPQRRSAGLTGSVAKVAAGALEHLPVARVVNLNRALDSLKQEGYRVIGLASEGSVSLEEADLDGPLVIVTGSEGDGLAMLTRRHCDQLVSIPLRGATPSLNASVATALLLYEVARRSWMKGLKGGQPAPRLQRPQLPAPTPRLVTPEPVEPAEAEAPPKAEEPAKPDVGPAPSSSGDSAAAPLPEQPALELELPEQPAEADPADAEPAAEPSPSSPMEDPAGAAGEEPADPSPTPSPAGDGLISPLSLELTPGGVSAFASDIQL